MQEIDSRLVLPRTIGQIMMFGGAVVLVLFFFNLRSRLHYHGPDYSLLFWVAACAEIIGIGLLFFKKWAAVLLAVTWCGVGAASIVGASLSAMRGGSWFAWVAAIVYGVPLCWIPIRILRRWPLLRW